MAFSFIDPNFTGPTASGVTPLSSLEFGNAFYGDEKIAKFRIGSTYIDTEDCYITASGVNAVLLDGVEFSTDGKTYAASLSVSGVVSNSITDAIFCKFTCPSEVPLSSGYFLIDVRKEQYE